MKKGRISKKEESYIKTNIEAGYEKIASELSRDPDSVLEFIRRKIVEGKIENPSWLIDEDPEKQAEYELTIRPYWSELQKQFTEEELQLFKYHWARVISQFRDDVMPTEEMQVVDLIKLELLMNRSLEGNKQNITDISRLEGMLELERSNSKEVQDVDLMFNMERQIASYKASQESLNKDYRELQTKKNSMLKEMKATREQRVKRLEDSKHNFTSWLTHLATNPEITKEYGITMEKMRMAMEKEKERLSSFHKYTDGLVDQPFLTPETVRD
jgi:hypothetical protein